MPSHIITLLALAALVTACSGYAPGTFRGYPLLKRSEPTVFLASTSIYEKNPADLSRSNIFAVAYTCQGLTCTNPNEFQMPHILVTAENPSIPVDEITVAGRTMIFRENTNLNHGRVQYRLLARGDQAAISVDHWTPETDPDGPGLHSSITQTLARGHLRAEPGTPVPPGTWHGTAILHHIHQPDIFHLADASLTMREQSSNTPFHTFVFETAETSPYETTETAPLEPFRQFIFNINRNPANITNGSIYNDFKASLHGSQHEIAIVVFTNLPRRITGGPILYREVPEEQ